MPEVSKDAPIFLIGFMASGKTTVGRRLAERMGWSFRDLDQIITQAAGRSVAQIFADPAEGEAGFRRRESEAVRAACGLRRAVIATGGGAACQEANLAAMLGAGRVVALSVTPDEVVRRAGPNSGRPLLAEADALGAATRLLAAREPFYQRAHHKVDTVGKSSDAVAAEVLGLLKAGLP